jgi:hypothetical protein
MTMVVLPSNMSQLIATRWLSRLPVRLRIRYAFIFIISRGHPNVSEAEIRACSESLRL